MFFNRELSWLAFNERVLNESRHCPIWDGLRFISIFSSNLDEFFMVRVGSLQDRERMRDSTRDNKTGLTSTQQLKLIYKSVKDLYQKRDLIYCKTIKALRSDGINIIRPDALAKSEKRKLRQYFSKEILPLLSPQIVDAKHPFPHFENGRPYLGVRIKEKKSFGFTPIPMNVEKVIKLDGSNFVLIEDVFVSLSQKIFGKLPVEECCIFRVTRNADIMISEEHMDIDDDFAHFVNQEIKKRNKMAPVRLELSLNNHKISQYLSKKLNLSEQQAFISTSPLSYEFMDEIEKIQNGLLSGISYKYHSPGYPPDIKENEPIIEQILLKDLLLSLPYDSFEPYLQFLRESINCPDVTGIRITLYRTGQHSRIVRLLCEAAEKGIDVLVMIELKARFDESNNIECAAQLREAGCNVVYGLNKCKVHAKLTLITRRHQNKIIMMTHFGTGNYNEKTAALYTDIGLFSTRSSLGRDALYLFNHMSLSVINGIYKHLLVAPFSLKRELLAMIDEEIEKTQNGLSGSILVKINSLTDKEICEKLIEASKCGVFIRLIIRGICCVRPNDNLKVVSVLGRFLEHSRIYIFGRGNAAKVYISSADWMTRNLEQRIESAVPLNDPRHKSRLIDMLETMLCPEIRAWHLLPNGSYELRGEIDCQEYFRNN